jgi:cold shock CspA family protein
VSSFDLQDGHGRLLLDDGSELDFPTAAAVAGGLRLLRPGQRVLVERADGESGGVEVVRIFRPA